MKRKKSNIKTEGKKVKNGSIILEPEFLIIDSCKEINYNF